MSGHSQIAVAAAALPSLLAHNPPPSPTFLNQALALAGCSRVKNLPPATFVIFAVDWAFNPAGLPVFFRLAIVLETPCPRSTSRRCAG